MGLLDNIKARKHTKWIAFEIHTEGMVAIALSAKPRPTIIDITSFELSDMWYDFEQWVRRIGFEGVQVVRVLPPNEYELILTEAPDVDGDDLRDALFWKSHEIADFNPNDTAFEYFELPKDSYRGRVKMVYGVALPKQLIIETEQRLKSLKLELATVTITELALGHLFTGSAKDAFLALSFHENFAMVTAYSQDALYFTRHFSVSNSSELDETFLNSVGLEVQRSIDYLESQVGVRAPSSIFVVPSHVAMPYSTIVEKLDAMVEQHVHLGIGRHKWEFKRIVSDEELFGKSGPLGGLVQHMANVGQHHANH